MGCEVVSTVFALSGNGNGTGGEDSEQSMLDELNIETAAELLNTPTAPLPFRTGPAAQADVRVKRDIPAGEMLE